MNNIRNFVIIAHIDHGKSTLADRLLEITGAVDPRRMRPQYLDQLELERERGITIKMAPVRMMYHAEILNSNLETPNKSQIQNSKNLEIRNSDLEIANSKQEFVLNLIDTPGHSDFSYEVSRALAAVEGAILLVDAFKGIQAQTLSNFYLAQKAGLKIIGAVNKIDLNPPNLAELRTLLADLIQVPESEIFSISGKTGEGVTELLEAVIERVPPPSLAGIDTEKTATQQISQLSSRAYRSLIFDSLYDDHKGIVAFVRVFEGQCKTGDEMYLLASGTKCRIKEVGYFAPELKPAAALAAGEIGYVATGIKEPALVKIGDTITTRTRTDITRTHTEKIPFGSVSSQYKSVSGALPGYQEPTQVIFVSFYSDGRTKFEDLRRAFERLRLTDSALGFEQDSSEALGRGLKVGFLGQLHFEITASRLQREFGLEFLTSFPSIAYRVKERGTMNPHTFQRSIRASGKDPTSTAGSSYSPTPNEGVGMKIIKDANDFPSDPDQVWQPMIQAEILTPPDYLKQIVNLSELFHLEIIEIKNIGENIIIVARMPLAELMRDFADQLKSVSAGYASFGYKLSGEASAEVEKLEILLNDEVIPALTRIVFKKEAEAQGRASVERLKELLPGQQFSQALQARVRNRIIARETIPALRKDVTDYLYGGDRTRKMKLWKKQKAGKEKLKKLSRVNLSAEVFRELLKK